MKAGRFRCGFTSITSLVLVASAVSGMKVLAAAPASKPNILVIFTDDHGFADLGAQGIRTDVKTPHLDRLAADGVRCTRGYVTAPQCVPSRAGLLTGRHQNRFGVEDNLKGPLPHSEKTVADRLRAAGYLTGMVGKWHLDVAYTAGQPSKGKRTPAKKSARGTPQAMPDHLPPRHGFDEYFCGAMRQYHASHDLEGRPLEKPPQLVPESRFRVDVQTEAALSFIERNHERPFFLYLAYFAPHVPLEATPEYLSRFPGEMPEERRLALAMIAAMDDGVGRIRKLLAEKGISQQTLVFFISDNGAPLKPGAWDGSLNEPLVGEKGMLTDGGVRVPFMVAWPGILPQGVVYEQNVSSLDVAATAITAAGVKVDPSWKLEGVDLVPYLSGHVSDAPHPELFWRWRSQAAVLAGNWKYLRVADEEFLFDTRTPGGERRNVLREHAAMAATLKAKLDAWCHELPQPGFPQTTHAEDQLFFQNHALLRLQKR
ncbi:MAG: sulfatase [Planctomycetota bacterium]